MNLIDEVSGLVIVKFMKNKSEVSAMIKEGLREMRKLFRLPAPANATLQSDGEAIYKSKNVQNMLEELQLFQQFSPTYHPERNGSAERAYRTCFNDARAMLMSSPLPSTYYP